MKRKSIHQMEPWFGEEERNALNEYMKSGGWITEFKKTQEFEKLICEYTKAKYCFVVNNGTISLTLAALASGIQAEDEVIVPDYTMIATPNSVKLFGAKPVFADVEPETLCLDIEKVENVITKKTKAIMLATINGRYPKADIDKFIELSEENDLILIEDAAQSLGSFYPNGKHIGTMGNVGSFSFSAPKIISTGQGGAIITDDEEIAYKVKRLKDFGRASGGNDIHNTIGWNFKFTDIQAVIGIEQMKKLDWRVKRKKEIYRLYKNFLGNVEEIDFIDTNLDDTSPWFIDILVKAGEKKRDELTSFLDKSGVGSRPFYPAIHTQPPYSWVKGKFPNAEYISKRGLWLPSASFLDDNDIEYACQLIKNFFIGGKN